jgi:predicted transglutaminase-like protease
LRADTATYDQELDKGIYTGHFSWNNQKIPVDTKHEYHAKIFEFQPKVLDGGKDKNK